jgi:hypothetical protein
MSARKKPGNFTQRLLRKIWQSFNALTKAFVNWILRSSLVLNRRSRYSRAGFVLPTVVMVILVVILLTTAIFIRSFDRSKNASNYRVDEATLRAATPAIERARAKVDYLFSPAETDLTGNTPSETDISRVLRTKTLYSLSDEIPLKLQLQAPVQDDPSNPGAGNVPPLLSAWKFPVDTDNNGKFDSYTLYGVYFATPPTDIQGNDARPRTPVEARALPQSTGGQANCSPGTGNATSPERGWVPINGQLKRAFFTYVATVPINQQPTQAINGIAPTKFEAYKGNKGFTALEMQQDQARLALDNNAVWYNDDLEITNVPTFRLNGRIHTNGNLMVSNSDADTIDFLQVSSRFSCFYDPSNAKIEVGGNVAAGDVRGDALGSGNIGDSGNNNVQIDLYPRPLVRPGAPVSINATRKTTTLNPPEVAGNSSAFALRLTVLRDGALNKYEQQFPNQLLVTKANVQQVFPNVNKPNDYEAEISKEFEKKCPPGDNPQGCSKDVLQQVLDTYFRKRIRRVSYKEISIDDPIDKARQAAGGVMSAALTPPAGEAYVFAGKPGVIPPAEWMLIDEQYTQVPLKMNGAKMELPTSEPKGNQTEEKNIGDRVKVGNNLPQVWVKQNGTPPVYAAASDKQEINGVTWDDSGQTRVRKPITAELDDLGNTARGGYWEKAAARTSDLLSRDRDPAAQQLLGGLRVVTGAGIYIDGFPAPYGTGKRYDPTKVSLPGQVRSFLPPPPVTATELSKLYPQAGISNTGTNAATVVWPDTMPMYLWKRFQPGDPISLLTDLPPRTSSTPDPGEGLKGDLQMRATVVYHYKNSADKDQQPIACISSYYDPTNAFTADNANGISKNGLNYQFPGRTINPALRRQAYMVFPDGRWANEPLKNAFDKLDAGTSINDLDLPDYSAIDAAICALNILNGATPTPVAVGTAGKVPDGAITERAFLDARQVKALHKATVETDDKGNPANPPVPIAPTTSLADIISPEKMKIGELASTKVNASLAAPQNNEALTDKYTLPIEQRQPLEVRVTQIDLEPLRTTTIGGNTGGPPPNNNQEYLLPNSGLIYASRDDALPDISDVDRFIPNGPVGGIDNGGSATDFKLDPTRRANGIRLISSGNNGGNLARDNTYRTAEKGLILASDLPVYIQDNFNAHYPPGTTGNTAQPIEEFTQKLDANYNNFYDRAGKDLNFACRANQKAGCNTGDQWRAARILSDAVTLLSSNFRDGYRNEGDYDLNNNAGNSAVKARLKNGFWWNSFASSAIWYDPATGLPPIDWDTTAAKPGNQGSSYVMNGVTAIQRRTTFTEYQMEICRKLPVSECGPQDWTTTGAGTTAPIEPTVTTSSRYVRPEDRRYPRRVAFERDTATSKTGQLLLDANGFATPLVPGGPTNATPPQPLPYGVTPPVPTPPVDNTLWFWTTSANARPQGVPAAGDATNGFGPLNFEYNNTKKLYYLPPEPELPKPTATPAIPVVHERQLLLPGTPEFPIELQTTYPALTGLNGQTAADPSDYSACIGAGQSQSYDVAVAGTCPGPALQRINLMRLALNQLKKTPSATDPNVLVADLNSKTIPVTGTIPPLVATAKVNVFDLPALQLRGTLTLKRGQQSDPIFVFRTRQAVRNYSFANVQLTLDGVDPNNIFWVTNASLSIPAGNQLAGNFIGGNGSLSVDGSSIIGGRFLGFRGGGSITAGMKGLTATNQPLLVPVLQLHSPKGRPGPNTQTAFGGTGDHINEDWMPHAAPTTFNAALIMGDSPSRPAPADGSNKAETGGGLGNFPRFLEAWEGQEDNQDLKVAKISGSLIQFKKSAFATAPYQSIDDPDRDTSLFFDGASPDYTKEYVEKRYQYKGGAQGRVAPYYRAPQRQWGYDVGFLSQSADLFSKRFGTPSAGTPSEFYRSVGRDDPWVKTLLCAAEKAPGSTAYDAPAIDARPADCPALPYNQPES